MAFSPKPLHNDAHDTPITVTRTDTLFRIRVEQDAAAAAEAGIECAVATAYKTSIAIPCRGAAGAHVNRVD
jgi:hypothetical protein